MRAHFAAATTRETKQFHCKRCGHEQDAVIVGVGEGAASDFNSPGTLEERAREAARADVFRTLAVARCPKCGRRSGVAGWWVSHLIGLVAVFALTVFAGWAPLLFDMNMREGDKWTCGWVLTGIAVVVVVPMTLISVLPKWSGIDRRVTFL